jgi:ABC-type Zn uptake system ZnuABC Zn-binding protein ZnuA
MGARTAALAAGLLLLALAATLSGGCERPGGASAAKKGDAEPGAPKVVATTTMLHDLVEVLGGDDVEAHGIMKPGADPHLYKPSPRDATAVASSQMVVTSGLGLEGWIDDLVRNAGGERPVVVAGEGVDPIRMGDAKGGVDPHFWFDVELWKTATDNVADGLVELVGPDSAAAERIRRRQKNYTRTLDALDAWVATRLETIPAGRRVLVTSHDAFNYFGRAYEIDVVGIQGISTEQEASQRDVANIVELVRRRGAPAVFVESSVNPATIERVATETGIDVAGPLFTDSVGPRDGPAGSYVGMIVENVRQVTEALGGKYEKFDPNKTGPNKTAPDEAPAEAP